MQYGPQGRLLLSRVLFLLIAVALANSLWGQQVPGPSPSAVTAFVDVTVVPMTHNGVLRQQTVIVEGSRIVEIGPTSEVSVPPGGRRVDGMGCYLTPGLVDTHIHLEQALGARPHFGDAPLFLASGVTTVFNLRGSPEELTLRSLIQEDKLRGPNLYTSGEFINEPLENTPDEIEREVVRQVTSGYDILKLHEIEDDHFHIVTTTGLSRASYDRLIESARRHHIPLVGHVSTELGLAAALADGQNLAHAVMYILGYFLPLDTKAFHRSTILGLIGLGIVLVVVIIRIFVAIVHRLRRRIPLERTGKARGTLIAIYSFAAAASVLTVLFCSLQWLANDLLIYAITIVGITCVILGGTIVFRTLQLWRSLYNSRTWMRIEFAVVSLSVIVFLAALGYFVPLSWRATRSGVERVASLSAANHIQVMTTLVTDYVSDMSRDPTLRHLSRNARKDWGIDDGTITDPPGLLERFLGPHVRWFQRYIVGELHRAGVILLLGTDTFGFPGVAPGISVHKELRLLEESGLSPYEALMTTTVNPATFLGKPSEFGKVVVGQRADLLLLQSNPLEQLQAVETPIGVMVRGHWFEAQELKGMVDTLTE